ncbi:pantoate--beta-alanine ligase [Haloimpatiens sp. FM7330]|uniref:pantoate--beta-alanine ligase n=1 Tax=Haloimpatiens sp. FM7330 TaxID=3298610 RepID=UPI00363DB04F
MKIASTIEEVRKYIIEWKKEGFSVGLVPTMGYLHEGHESLIKKSASDNDKTVVSVFLNPIQFGKNEDLDTYPSDIDRDLNKCKNCGADLIFTPQVSEMYFNDFCTYVNVDNLTKGLCGAKRPGHFKGVCTIVSKLFNIVTPDKAYFGQKDAQQLAVIKRMVRDLNFNIKIIGCPIVREEDGLAKSSRNSYLSSEERKASLILYKSLMKAKKLFEKNEFDSNKIKQNIIEVINTEPLAKIDYVEIVDNTSLKPVNEIKNSTLIALAVYIGKTRLIDNIILGGKKNELAHA